MAKNTCHNCKRTVVLVATGDGVIATDPELINVVPARETFHASSEQPKIVMRGGPTFARRVHADMCEGYVEQARKERIRAEMLQFNQNQTAPKAERAGRAARKNRGL